jgi:hypothetical protein
MTRPEAGILTTLLIFPFAFFIALKLKNLKSTIYAIIIFSLLVLFLQYTFIYLIPPKKLAGESYDLIPEKYELYMLNLNEFEFTKNIKIANNKDSLKIEALKFRFSSDKKMLTNDFLEKYSTSNIFSFSKLTLHRFKVVLYDILNYVINLYIGITVINLFLFIVMIFGSYENRKFIIIIYLVPQVLFFLLLFSIDVFMKMPERIFVPLYTVFTVCNLWQMQRLKINPKFNKFSNIFLILIIISFSASSYYVILKHNSIKAQNKENIQIFDYLGNKFNNTTFLITLNSYSLLEHLDPLKNLDVNNNKLLPIVGWTINLPSYYKELKSISSSSDIYGFLNYICNNRNYIIISDEKFIEFLTSYFKILYNNEFKFVSEFEIPDIIKERDLNLYTIKK